MKLKYFNSDGYLVSAENHRYLFYMLWALLIGITAWNSEGWLQPDEHARVLEPAHYIAYGFASLPWEITENSPIVSWLLGTLISPFLMLTRFLHFDGLSEAAFIRCLVGLLASTRFFAIWDIMNRLGLKSSRRIFYLLFMMTAVYGPLFLVRTSQENFATTALVWALYWAFQIRDEGLSKNRGIIFAALLAFTASARPQVGVAAAGLGLWLFYEIGPRIILPAIIGIFIGLLPLAIVDYKTTGAPFLPAYHYLTYALGDENGGKVWGTSPWWFYIQQYFESWYPPLAPFLLIPLALGAFISPVLASIIIPFTLAHVILGHKETRYFSPMIPMMQLCMFLGIERLENSSAFVRRLTGRKSFWLGTLKVVAVLTLLAGLIPLNSSPWMYEELGRHIRTGTMENFTYIGNTMSGFSQFYAKVPNIPPYKQISWNDVRDGKENPSGWLAFYALDPDDFRRIEQKCGHEGFHRYPDWYINAMTLFPRSPARRRMNPIVYCANPLMFNAEDSAQK